MLKLVRVSLLGCASLLSLTACSGDELYVNSAEVTVIRPQYAPAPVVVTRGPAYYGHHHRHYGHGYPEVTVIRPMPQPHMNAIVVPAMPRQPRVTVIRPMMPQPQMNAAVGPAMSSQPGVTVIRPVPQPQMNAAVGPAMPSQPRVTVIRPAPQPEMNGELAPIRPNGSGRTVVIR